MAILYGIRKMPAGRQWIAATAIALGVTLITRDNDFQGIAGLAIEDWTN